MSALPETSGLCNVRPVPGVRDGLVLRGDLPRWLGPDDLEALGPIASQIDLRSVEEAELDGIGVLVDAGTVRHHVPYGEPSGLITAAGRGSDDIEANYRAFTQMGVFTVVQGLELLTTIDLPVFIHCTAGKDRTGVLVIALALALGVSGAAVIDDYMVSALAMEDLERRYWLLPSTQARANPVPPSAYPVLRSLPTVVVEEIESAGGIAAWLATGNAAPDLIDRLRSRIGQTPREARDGTDSGHGRRPR
jgi:hypothetical protein